MILLVITVITSLFFRICLADLVAPYVNTKYGEIEGIYKTSTGNRTYVAFEGIPYAKPPVGDLRFEPPVPFGKWEGKLFANKTYVCPQVMYSRLGPKFGQEDCLYLNVYIPIEKMSENANLSVIVNIHGGAFSILSASMGAEEIFIMNRDVVYVNLNYRLGIFGFLSMEDELFPGNMGLKDQLLALKWVKANIKTFGGNPDSITLVGASAGGASVHYHILSPLSKGLFHKAISQSGTSLNMWALIKDSKQRVIDISKDLNCTEKENSKMLVECLRNIPTSDILSAEKRMFKVVNTYPPTLFGPVVEKGPNAFLPEHPYKLLSSGKFTQVPWMNSNTIEEGLYPYAAFLMENYIKEFNDRWDELLPIILDYTVTANKSDWLRISREIREFYLGGQSIPEAFHETVEFFSDRFFIYDSRKTMMIHAEKSNAPVYYYRYSFDDGLQLLGVKGVAHVDDAKIMFRMINCPKKLSKEVVAMQNVLLDMVYSFATTSKPVVGGVEMPEFKGSSDDLVVNIISPTNVTVENLGNLRSQVLWDKLPIMENDKLFS